MEEEEQVVWPLWLPLLFMKVETSCVVKARVKPKRGFVLQVESSEAILCFRYPVVLRILAARGRRWVSDPALPLARSMMLGY